MTNELSEGASSSGDGAVILVPPGHVGYEWFLLQMPLQLPTGPASPRKKLELDLRWTGYVEPRALILMTLWLERCSSMGHSVVIRTTDREAVVVGAGRDIERRAEAIRGMAARYALWGFADYWKSRGWALRTDQSVDTTPRLMSHLFGALGSSALMAPERWRQTVPTRRDWVMGLSEVGTASESPAGTRAAAVADRVSRLVGDFVHQELAAEPSSAIWDFCNRVVAELTSNVQLHSRARVGLAFVSYSAAGDDQPITGSSISQLSRRGIGHLRLTIADNGVGLAEGLRNGGHAEAADDLAAIEAALGLRRGLSVARRATMDQGGTLTIRTNTAEITFVAEQPSVVYTPSLPGTEITAVFPAKLGHQRSLRRRTLQPGLFGPPLPTTSGSLVRIRRFALAPSRTRQRVEELDLTARAERAGTIARSLDPDQFLAVDLKGITTVQQRVLSEALLAIVDGVDRAELPVVAINVSPSLTRLLRDSLLEDALRKSHRLLIMFSPDRRPTALGLSPKLAAAFECVVDNTPVPMATVLEAAGLTRDDASAVERWFPPGGKFYRSFADESGDLLLSAPDFRDALSRDVIDWFGERMLESGALHEGHFELPNGRHSTAIVESRRILDSPDFVEAVAAEIGTRLDSEMPTLVFGLATSGAVLCHYVARALGLDRYAVAIDRATPLPALGKIQAGDRVLVIADVLDSGNTLRRMQEVVLAQNASVTASMSFVAVGDADRTTWADENVAVHALFRAAQRSYSPAQCPVCAVDPTAECVLLDTHSLAPLLGAESTGAPTVVVTQAKRLSDDALRRLAQLTRDYALSPEQGSFWEQLVDRAAGIRRGHFVKNDRHYSFYDYTERILASPKFRSRIGAIADAWIPEQIGEDDIDFIVHPDEVSQTLLAHIIASELRTRPRVLPAFRAPGSAYQVAAPVGTLASKKVLLVDDTVYTGQSLTELRAAVSGEGAQVVGTFVLMDRSTKVMRPVLEQYLMPFFAVLRFEIPAYSAATCPFCFDSALARHGLMKSRTSVVRQFLRARLEELEPRQP